MALADERLAVADERLALADERPALADERLAFVGQGQNCWPWPTKLGLGQRSFGRSLALADEALALAYEAWP
eukprot:s4701_g1.t1